jgi:hypothetical protein
VDFTSLNKACPKDPYLLPRINQIVDSTTGCDLLCFLDAFSGYHQINMAKEDEEKTAFITPCGVYCYVCMPFGLKNAGATFQRLMLKALGAQMGRNAEVYIDDIVVKTLGSHTFIEDLEETSVNLRKVNIKLNPAKCTFGMPSGKLLGFLVSHRGIEANPNKVKVIEEMRPLRNLKEMQRLAGCMAALGRFIARTGEKALPFFKLMKRTGKFEWTPKADKAFTEEVPHEPTNHGCPNIPRALAALHRSNSENSKHCPRRGARHQGNRQRGSGSSLLGGSSQGKGINPFYPSRGAACCSFADRAAPSELSMDFVSQEHGVPCNGPKDSNAGG